MIPLELDPGDDLARQNEKLRRIVGVLMGRVEREMADHGPSYSHFQLAAALEEQVRARTKDLDDALKILSISNARLTVARQEAERARNDLYDAIEVVQEGFAIFDPSDVLILSNSRFAADIPDVAAKLGPGLQFVDYVRHVAQSPHLQLPEGVTPSDWARQRLSSHRRPHVNFIVRLTGDRWIQVSEHRSPSNGTAIIQTDVSDMIRREREERDRLLDGQARLVRATLDHISQGVAIFDATQRLAGLNQRLHQLVALPVHLMQRGTDFRPILAYLRAGGRLAPAESPERLSGWAAEGGGRPPLALELRRSDGAILDLLAREVPDRGFVVSFTDMTAEREAVAALQRVRETLESRVQERTAELEEARDEAERANASKSRFVAGASHDLLQPLNAAKLFLSSLMHTGLDGDQAAIAQRIRSAFESVETILGALLDISNLDIGAAKAEIAAVPLGPLFASIAQEFQPLARERGLAFRVMPSALVLESDPAYLRRILQNLVVNALRYTREGKVLVGARRLGCRVRLEVWDTGPGIPPERTADVFREFVRLDTSGDAPQGMGLGLAIVERSCALLAHPLTLASVPGRGTRFSVDVPRIEAARSAGTPPSDPLARPAPALDDMIVLVIENDDDVRAGMLAVLEDWGTSPLEARGLAEAEALIGDIGVGPDVVIADYLLDDGENGIDAINALRAAHGPVPAVLVSADRSLDLRHRASEHEITLLHKPVELRRLRAVLQWAKTQPSRAAG
ncbi:PAS-domain containing protein [soil metagenome]